MTVWFFDTEQNGSLYPWTLSPKAPEVATENIAVGWKQSGEKAHSSSDITDFMRILSPGDTIVFHYGIRHDLPALEKLCGISYTVDPDTLGGVPVNFVDTLILSKLLNPDRLLHSLEGVSGMKKQGEPEVFNNQLTYEDVESYQEHDCIMQEAAYYNLMAEAGEQDLSLPYWVEKLVAHYHHKQEVYGVLFDQEKAKSLVSVLNARMRAIEERVLPLLPRREIPKSRLRMPPKLRFKKDGTPSANSIKYFGDKLYELDGEWWVTTVTAIESVLLSDYPSDKPLEMYESMSLADDDDVKKWLREDYGWKPTIWNTRKKTTENGKRGERTSPKFHDRGDICPNLLLLGEKVDFVQDIIDWMLCRHRRNVIDSPNGTGWLHNPRLEIDGRLSAQADTIGTNTFRYTHKCVANVPNSETEYGPEMRELFRVPEGKKLVGWDAKGIEDRMKAHYLHPIDGGLYSTQLEDPEYDSHRPNEIIWNVSRSTAKRGLYCLTYDGQAPRFSETIGVDKERGTELWEEWWDRNWALAELKDNLELFLQTEGLKEYLPGIDGRRVRPRNGRALVNTVCQSSAIIVMKYAMVFFHKELERQGLQDITQQVIHYHDEVQAETVAEYAQQIADLGVWSIEAAGKFLGIRVPLFTDAKLGLNWSETH